MSVGYGKLVTVLQQPKQDTVTLSMVHFPHPYKAALAICSDLDETPDARTYFELMRFLNTKDDTAMGQGVGLEVGNSIYFDMPPGQFSYWNCGERSRENIRTLIRCGYIDCLHSYGDLATTRAHAERALAELERHGCRLKVWVDHAQAASNFGQDIMLGHGDEPGHPAYHADITMAHGIRFIWRGRVTSVIGQESSTSFRGLWSTAQPAASAVTILKEAAKQALANCGDRKYALHARNRVLKEVRLRDGQSAYEFVRCNPHPCGVSVADRGDRIHEVLSDRFLRRLVQRRGVCILYTHLGKLGSSGPADCFAPAVVEAFRRLAEYSRSGQILVTTTSKLLEHCAVNCKAEEEANRTARWSCLQFPKLAAVS